jgi:cytoskeletal protein RodZ
VKEIGERLKETRESIGISVEEAAEDLKMRPSQIEDVEAGNMNAFKDVFSLKYFVRDYSKYLGLDYENMVDEFNEYLFDYTSKLSLDDIRKAKKEDEKTKEPKIVSPYTLETKRKKIIPPIIIWILIVMVLGIVVYFVVDAINDSSDNTTTNSVLE